MKITLNEKEIKNALIMFLNQKMSLDFTPDVELSTQGKGGQTILATIDLDAGSLEEKKSEPEAKVEPKKEEEAVATDAVISNPDNNEALFSESEEEEKSESPFGSFA